MRFFRLILFLLLCLFLHSGSTYAQATGTVRGFVVDSTNGEALSNATVVAEGTSHGATTDQRGYFSIPSLQPGERILTVSYLGFRNKKLSVNIQPGKITQTRVDLVPVYIQLGEIETIGKRNSKENETGIGLNRITVKEIELLPRGVEADVMRALQFVPGVKSGGDVSARYYVRGGSGDQNLILMNNVPVYNPFHAMGLFSVIDPDMINSLEFYKGGFTSEFGGRLSSVLNLVTKDGNRNRFSGNVNIGSLTGKMTFEGPLPGGSFILTGRKSLFNDVLSKFFNYQDAPFSFYDIFLKANLSNTSEKSHTKVSVFAFNSGDELNNKNALKEDYEWTNTIFGVEWFQVWESPLYSETSVSFSNARQQINANQSENGDRNNKISDVTLKMDFTYLLDSRDEIKVGYYLKSFKSALNYTNSNGVFTSINDFSANINLYTKYKLLRFSDLVADIGTRINVAPLALKTPTFEPRVNVLYKLHPMLSLKAAWGIYSQEMVTLLNENELITLFEPWTVIPDYLKSPVAVHYVAGASLNLSENLSMDIEGYYKNLQNITDLNQNKALPTDPDLVSGSGESYGWECLMKYQDQRLNASLAYSLSWAYKEINGWRYYPRYDSRHSVTFSGIYDLGSEWQFGTNWMFSTGIPFTQIEGFYDKLYLDNLNSQPFIYSSYNPYIILASRNLGRLPYYHRLDFSLTKNLRLWFTNISMSFSILNVYDRKNIFYFERDTGKRVNMLPFLPSASLRMEL